jgi:hypothetical protein
LRVAVSIFGGCRICIGHSLVPSVPASHGEYDVWISIKERLEILCPGIDVGSWVITVHIRAFILEQLSIPAAECVARLSEKKIQDDLLTGESCKRPAVPPEPRALGLHADSCIANAARSAGGTRR